MTISEDSLHALFAGCPPLNSLMLENCYGFRRLRINSLSLSCFAMLFYERPATEILLQEVIVDNGPSLERLLYYGSLGDHDSVLSAPKLRMIGRFTNRLGRFEFGTTIFQLKKIVPLSMYWFNDSTISDLHVDNPPRR